jgi:hypothetical protein
LCDCMRIIRQFPYEGDPVQSEVSLPQAVTTQLGD